MNVSVSLGSVLLFAAGVARNMARVLLQIYCSVNSQIVKELLKIGKHRSKKAINEYRVACFLTRSRPITHKL